MLDLMNKLTQLSEATKETGKGRIHTAEPGGYGRKDDEDDEGKKVKADAPKKGRGRPKKDADDSGEVKKYDNAKNLQDFMVGNKPKGKELDKLPKKKHTLKDWVESIESKYIAEAEQISIKPASQMPKQPGQTSQPGQQQQVAGQTQKNTQVSAQGNKTLGTVDNPQLANQIKQSIGKGEMTLMPDEVSEGGALNAVRDRMQSGQGGALNNIRANMQQRGAGAPAVNQMRQGVQQRLGAMAGKPQQGVAEAVRVPYYGATGIRAPRTQAERDVLAKDVRTNRAANRRDNAVSGYGTRIGHPKHGVDSSQAFRSSNRVAVNTNRDTGQEVATDYQSKHFDPKHVDYMGNLRLRGGSGKGVAEGVSAQDKNISVGDYVQTAAGVEGVVKHISPDGKKLTIWNRKRQADHRVDITKAEKIPGIARRKMAEQGVAEGSDQELVNRQGSYWDQVAQEKKNRERDTLKDKKAEHEKTPIGKAEKYWAKKGVAEGSEEKGKRIAGAVLAKLRSKTNEADMPSDQVDMGAGLGAGRNQGVLEAKKGVNPFDKKDTKKKPEASKNKKPDANKDGIPDYAQDGKGAKDLGKGKSGAPKKGVNPFAKKDEKKKVKEGMEQSLQAARLTGKSHGLKGHSHCGKNYEDMEEARMYHEGYKEGLDECYGQGVYEQAPAMPPATPGGMASQAMEADMDEGNAFTAALARTPKGGKFSVGGKSFTDRTSYDSTFESLDSQLNALLEGKVDEGMTVSISKGQQGAPDSVSVTAQDGEADQLLQVIKQAGLGLFGGDDTQQGNSSPMSLQPADGQAGEMEIDVVDDHDGMMDLIKKVTGGQDAPAKQGFGDEQGSSDYEDEEGHADEHGHEGTCESCGGMMEAGHSCDEGEEKVDEVESYDQEIEIAAEDNAPDSDEAETTADENAEAAEDQALATADEENVNEWANDAGAKAKDFNDESFKTDMDFMTRVISGGLNKEKSTGQSTVPVVSTQVSRLGNPMQESINLLHDWKTLSGIK